MAASLVGLIVGLAIALGIIGLFWPGWGLVPRWRRATKTAERVRVEDTMKHLYESEVNGVAPSMQSVAGAARLSVDDAADVLQNLQRRRLIELEREGIRLTATGREMGLHVLRAHRLWESYLADQTGFPEPEWHGRAHDLEHGVSPAEVDALSARLRHPTHDPHGDPIPTPEGRLPRVDDADLLSASEQVALVVTRVTDQNPEFLRFVGQHDLVPGRPVTIVQRDGAAGTVRLRGGDGGERIIGIRAASRILVRQA